MPTGAKLREAPFHRPASQNDIRKMKELLRDGLDVNSEDDNGDTAIYYALGNGHITMADLLLEKGAHLNIFDHKGQSLKQKVLRSGPQASIDWLRNHGY